MDDQYITSYALNSLLYLINENEMAVWCVSIHYGSCISRILVCFFCVNI